MRSAAFLFLVLPAALVAQDSTESGDRGPPRPVRTTATCVITRIVDGDTVYCQPAGSVRLIGIDAPERGQTPFHRQATDALAAMLPVGETVELELDVEPRDRYDRVLGYLWRDSVLVNWRMVREGWAVMLTYPPNVQYVDAFTAAVRAAQRDSIGLWAVRGFDCLPRDHRRQRC